MDKKDKALLIGVNINNKDFFKESMEELKSLTEACNIQVEGFIEQNLKEPNISLYVGTGKLEEIKKDAKDLEIDVVIFNNELSPSQLRNLQKELDIPILDRTSLILEIFALRAKTRESKLQVEVARLKYLLPRLVGLHDSLGRQGGGSGISNKGSGEKKLELDKRRIEDKLIELNKELENVSRERDNQSRKRKDSGIPMVSLVGYTNAGKSTLMNSFMDMYNRDENKKVFQENMLFATLETSIRNITLEDNKTFLLSDTVGFISDLPHNLIKAFRSTLDEVRNANLLLQVIDYSDDNSEEQIKVTNQTLKELGADNIPIIYVYNKSDLVLEKLPLIDGNTIYMSAHRKTGMKELIELIKKNLFSNYIKCKMKIPFEKGNILSYLNETATIFKTEYEENGTIIELECNSNDYIKYQEYVV